VGLGGHPLSCKTGFTFTCWLKHDAGLGEERFDWLYYTDACVPNNNNHSLCNYSYPFTWGAQCTAVPRFCYCLSFIMT